MKIEAIWFWVFGYLGITIWIAVAIILIKRPSTTRKLFAGVLSFLWGILVFLLRIVSRPTDSKMLVAWIVIIVIIIVTFFLPLYFLFDKIRRRILKLNDND
jgi:hypothetical protein